MIEISFYLFLSLVDILIILDLTLIGALLGILYHSYANYTKGEQDGE